MAVLARTPEIAPANISLTGSGRRADMDVDRDCFSRIMSGESTNACGENLASSTGPSFKRNGV